MGAEQSKPKAPFDVKLSLGGLDICYESGEKVRLSVANGALTYFEITADDAKDAALAAAGAIAIVVFSNFGHYLLERAASLGASAIASIVNSVTNFVGSATTSGVQAVGGARAAAGGARAATGVAEAAVGARAAAGGAKAAAGGTRAAAGAAEAAGGVAAPTLSNAAKICGGVGGGLGIVFGIVDVGLGIDALVNGTATLNRLVSFKKLLDEAEKKSGSSSLDEKKREIVREAKKKIDALVVDADEFSKGTNGTKIAGGAITTVGGGLAIAGIFFPPLFIPAAVVGGVGAVASVTSTIVDLCGDHEKRLRDIVDGLEKEELYLIVG